MLKFVAVALSLLVVCVKCYDEKFDKIDIDKILKDDALFNSYINCFLDKGPCTAEYSSEYKEMLPEVLSDGCAKCTKIQRENFKKVLKEVFENKKDALLEIKNKYDPKGEYEGNIKNILAE
ncbi:ejaculatory bulb-specific protein 3-like [Vanessa cardui]|uniref:ejaculatory bulb-specific protein 3-like n=1 Tax=Vanessa cardui TaxID=171605 RepID=UPI001F134EDD|nr:ejaculatory bulb-specific protein 3-like [Vanessa cardui]